MDGNAKPQVSRVRQAPSYISAVRGGAQHGKSSKAEWKHKLHSLDGDGGAGTQTTHSMMRNIAKCLT
jgi:hypothetical protein